MIYSLYTRYILNKILRDKPDNTFPFDSVKPFKKKWSKGSLDIVGLDPIYHFGDDFRLEDNLVIICNHRSFLDILVVETLIHKLSNKKSTFIAKKELESSFIFGKLYKMFGSIYIDRDKPRDFIKLIKRMKLILTKYPKGNMFVIYPEGTRNKNYDNQTVEEFKEGFLKMSQKLNLNVLPVFIDGNIENYFENVPRPKKEINVYVGDIIKINENISAVEVQKIYKKSFNIGDD